MRNPKQSTAPLLQVRPVRIREWATCGATVDSAKGVAAAFAAAKNGAFTLEVDCPVFIHIGADIARPIFVDSGTTVNFSGDGKFIVDNMFVPAFAIVNSSNITFTNWRVQYSAITPVDPYAEGYYNNGVYIRRPVTAATPQADGFNDYTLKKWMIAHRGVVFEIRAPLWIGPVDVSAIFYFRGTASKVPYLGLNFLWLAMSAAMDMFRWRSRSISVRKITQTIKATTPVTSEFYATPSNLTFTDIDLDGTYMGWQGNLQNATFTHIRSHRYADLQDAHGGNSGGIGKWFAPPHLFYLNFDPNKDLGLMNKNLKITDVIDYGNRAGVARDKGGVDTKSGNALSLKIGGANILVDGYQSYRPDGFLDLLTSNGFTLRNVKATYNSAFLNYVFPAIRFPGPTGVVASAYKNINIYNVSITDLAPSTNVTPIWMNRGRGIAGSISTTSTSI